VKAAVSQVLVGTFACSDFSQRKSISVAKFAQLLKSATEKPDPQKASFTFGRDLRPKARKQNSATESMQTEFRDRK